ncbi:PCRF domain-containing protein [Actinomadura sp. NPDC047616]|uniref:PCRF domain-containing protein n=1 Tax=Actinomadura sp. NPDC047616 TaxID=3155914 RepID=UPI0033C8694F
MDEREIIAEYAALDARLCDPAVHRDHGLARLLRRRRDHLRPLYETAVHLRSTRDDLTAARELEWHSEAAALAARSAALQDALSARLAGWDRYDPNDVVLFIDAVSDDALWLARHYQAAARPGWRVTPLDGRLDAPRPHAVLGITAGEGGPGAWAALKTDNGLHAKGRALARVTVLPDVPDATADPGALTIGLLCTRDPGAPTTIRVDHTPSGIAAFGVNEDQRRARADALRQVHARLAAAALTPADPAYHHIASARSGEVTRTH